MINYTVSEENFMINYSQVKVITIDVFDFHFFYTNSVHILYQKA